MLFAILAVIALVVVVIFVAKSASRSATGKVRAPTTKSSKSTKLAPLPERFVVFDLETTGLDCTKHEIIEIGAIRVNRDSTKHDTFQALVKPLRKVPKRITDLTGITQSMVEADGGPIAKTVSEFLDFAGELPLVSFNAEFDMGFLSIAAQKTGRLVSNPVTCALVMARRAWPGRKSYRLADLARDGNLGSDGAHRALEDCKRTLIVYAAAAAKLRVAS